MKLYLHVFRLVFLHTSLPCVPKYTVDIDVKSQMSTHSSSPTHPADKTRETTRATPSTFKRTLIYRFISLYKSDNNIKQLVLDRYIEQASSSYYISQKFD